VWRHPGAIELDRGAPQSNVATRRRGSRGKGGSNRAAHGDVVKAAYGDVGSSMLHEKDGGGGETWLL
jgi:hypothetical protein